MHALKISEISSASPNMDALAFQELKADIAKRGQLLPIWVRDGEIIDGRKRFNACQELGITPKILETTADDPRELANALNILRTHYT